MNKKILILPEIYDNVFAWWPFAVVRKIYESDNNKKFDYIKKKWNLEMRNIKSWSIKKKLINFLKFFLWKINSFPIVLNIFKLLFIDLIKLHKNKIKKYSIVISHDIFKSFIILNFYKTIKVINIYHWQWSMYTEYINLWGWKKNFFMKKILNYIENYVYINSYKIWFPSKGTYEALISTRPELKKIINKYHKKYEVLYNSIDFSVKPTHNKEIEDNLISDWYNFVTVSSIIYQKWVDRIPIFFKSLKDKWIKFKWILIWRRNDIYSPLLEKKIHKYNLQDYVYIYDVWWIPKSEIYWLLSKTDFYILFHRYSIFDLATLEAMYLWNIPILSNIWWNKEVILRKNWILFDENKFDNVDLFLEFIKENHINKLKESNINIINTHFNNNLFIERYYNLINEN